MSKYNKLPGLNEEEPIIKEAPKIPISKLCCLPILMEGSKGYKQQLSNFMTLEELMPATQRMQIYQMMYMDKLLEELREYRPNIEPEEQPKNPMEVISKMDKSGSVSKMTNTLTKVMKYKETGDMSVLMELLAPNNPMLSMLMPMLSMQSKGNSKGSGGGMNMMQSLLPMMMGQNPDMLSSLLGGIM